MENKKNPNHQPARVYLPDQPRFLRPGLFSGTYYKQDLLVLTVSTNGLLETDTINPSTFWNILKPWFSHMFSHKIFNFGGQHGPATLGLLWPWATSGTGMRCKRHRKTHGFGKFGAWKLKGENNTYIIYSKSHWHRSSLLSLSQNLYIYIYIHMYVWVYMLCHIYLGIICLLFVTSCTPLTQIRKSPSTEEERWWTMTSGVRFKTEPPR